MTLSSFHLAGIQLDSKTSNIGGQSMQDCGNLWQQFERESIFQKIPDKISEEVYAVYFDYDGDHLAPFRYFIGCRVNPESVIPAGLTELIIPEQNYITVTAKGQMPDCIGAAWKEIWQSDYNRLFTYDFEVYDERSRDWSNAEVDIYLSTR